MVCLPGIPLVEDEKLTGVSFWREQTDGPTTHQRPLKNLIYDSLLEHTQSIEIK
jgi:hypothetical protein